MSGFGECLSCGCSVERVGWDDLCFACQESEKAETVCAECDGDGYVDLLDGDGFVIGPAPCPKCGYGVLVVRPFRGLRRPPTPAEDGESNRQEPSSSDA